MCFTVGSDDADDYEMVNYHGLTGCVQQIDESGGCLYIGY